MSSSSSFSLAFASSEFKYDVFITLRDPKGIAGAYVVNKFRDAGITAFVEDLEKGFTVHDAVERSRIVMSVLTPEFLESEMDLKCLKVRINGWNRNLLAVYCGVSRGQVHEKMRALFGETRSASIPGFKLPLDFRQ